MTESFKSSFRGVTQGVRERQIENIGLNETYLHQPGQRKRGVLLVENDMHGKEGPILTTTNKIRKSTLTQSLMVFHGEQASCR